MCGAARSLACVKIDGNTSIPQSLLGYNSYRGEKASRFLVISGVWSDWRGVGDLACLHSAQGNVLGKFGQLGKQVKLSVDSGVMGLD